MTYVTAASPLEGAPVQPRHPHQSECLKADHAGNDGGADAGTDERLHSIRIRPPHQEREHIRNRENNCDRRMRFHALRPNTPRQLDAIANRLPHRGQRRRQAASDLPVNGERSGKQPERLEGNVHLQIAYCGARVVAEPNAPGDFLEIRPERRPHFLEGRLKRRQQAGARPKRSHHEIDRRRQLRFDQRGLLTGHLVFNQVREHTEQHPRCSSHLERESGHEPECAADNDARGGRGGAIARRERPYGAPWLFPRLDDGGLSNELAKPRIGTSSGAMPAPNVCERDHANSDDDNRGHRSGSSDRWKSAEATWTPSSRSSSTMRGITPVALKCP